MTQTSSEPARNVATLNDEMTLALRAITEKRAATIGYLLDESRQRHIADDFMCEAIHHYGRDIGHKLRAQMRDRQDLQGFVGLFTHGLESQVYEMEPVSASRAEFIALFHHCPYANCWWQQGWGASKIETLCDICMEGDHVLANAFPGPRLEVQAALIRDDTACRLRFCQSEPYEAEWQP